MASKSEPVDVDVTRATPFQPGDPREDIAVSQLGGTFAERAKARAAAEKRISSDSAENKAVKKATSKAKKKA